MVVVDPQDRVEAHLFARLDEPLGREADRLARLKEGGIVVLGRADAGADDVPAMGDHLLQALDKLVTGGRRRW